MVPWEIKHHILACVKFQMKEKSRNIPSYLQALVQPSLVKDCAADMIPIYIIEEEAACCILLFVDFFGKTTISYPSFLKHLGNLLLSTIQTYSSNFQLFVSNKQGNQVLFHITWMSYKT